MRKTAFHSYHLDHNGQMVEYAGFEMPIRYTSIIEEHNNVRTSLGMFDISHMGRVYFKGRHARKFLERVLTRRISDMPEGACRYSMVCNENGGVMDDVICYRFEDDWMLVVNAANREKLLAHFEAVKGDLSFKMDDRTEKTAMVAVQGPKAMEFISNFSKEIPTLKRYSFTIKNLMILKLVVSRTGYTGEDGIEIILPGNMVGMAMKLLDRENNGLKLTPAGLGARDTLRLEAGMPLYGHELTEEIDPLTAGLSFAVTLNKDEFTDYGGGEKFIGQDALKKIKEEGLTKKIIGLKLDGKRTPRQDMKVYSGETEVGYITSGCLSPTLGYPIAMALVDIDASKVGQTVQIDFGKKKLDAEIVKLPFYKAPKPKKG